MTMTMANTGTREFQGESTSQQGGGSAREQIRDVKNQVVDQAKNTFQQAKERAGTSLGESKGQLADQVGAVAEALRRTTENLRSEDQGRIAGLTETLARQIDQVANYLRGKDAAGMRQDLENMARRQPAVAIGGALLLGLIGARFLKSSERRNQREWREDRGYSEGRYGRESGYGYSRSRLGESTGGYSGFEETGGGYAGA
jgi:hypothetical protein